MKRDFELIRKILIDCETQEPGSHFNLAYDDYPKPVVNEHLRLLNSAEFLRVIFQTDHMNRINEHTIVALEWKGHDFLANAKNEKVWKKVMDKLKEKSIDVSVEIVKGMLTEAVKIHLGTP